MRDWNAKTDNPNGDDIEKSLGVTIRFRGKVQTLLPKKAKPIVHKQDNHFKVCSLHAVVGSAEELWIVWKRRLKDNNPLWNCRNELYNGFYA